MAHDADLSELKPWLDASRTRCLDRLVSLPDPEMLGVKDSRALVGFLNSDGVGGAVDIALTLQEPLTNA
jgi:hypothetical protein